jgi:hypothetical protein
MAKPRKKTYVAHYRVELVSAEDEDSVAEGATDHCRDIAEALGIKESAVALDDLEMP